jgi:hypothetical protein
MNAIVSDLCLRRIIKHKGKRITQENYSCSPNVGFSIIVQLPECSLSNTIILDHTRSVSYTMYYQPQQTLQLFCFRTRKAHTDYII